MFVEELKNTREWEDFLKVTPGGTFYHSIKWRDVIERTFSHPTVYLAIKSENGKLIGICPASIVIIGRLRVLDSLPYSDFGGPVIEKKYIREASLTLQKFIEEFSHEKGISCAKICFLKSECEEFFKTPRSYVDNSKGVVELDLTANSSVFIWEKIFRYKQRRNIKDFEKGGFQARKASTRSDLRTFLALYFQSMKHLGTLGYPTKFFENMWELFYPENFNILLVEKREVMGGLAFFKYGQTVYLTYLGIERELTSPRYRIVPFLIWRAIKWAEENGLRYVCFGSTPAHPKTANERANYLQKIRFGGSFQQQETVFIPFDFYASAILLLGPKVIRAWKAIRNALPPKLQKAIERELRGMF